MSRAISIMGMLIVLVLACALDVAVAFIRLENLRTFDVGPWRLIALFDIAELGFAISIVAFGWLFLFKSPKSAMVSSIVLIVGLLLFFSYPLTMLFPNLAIGIFLGPLDRFVIVAPFTYEFHAATLLAVMAAAGLLRTIAGFRAGTRSETVASNT